MKEQIYYFLNLLKCLDDVFGIMMSPIYSIIPLTCLLIEPLGIILEMLSLYPVRFLNKKIKIKSKIEAKANGPFSITYLSYML